MADAKATDSALGLLLQLYWMLGGNAILAIAAYPDLAGLRHWRRYVVIMLPVSVLLPVGVLVKNPG